MRVYRTERGLKRALKKGSQPRLEIVDGDQVITILGLTDNTEIRVITPGGRRRGTFRLRGVSIYD